MNGQSRTSKKRWSDYYHIGGQGEVELLSFYTFSHVKRDVNTNANRPTREKKLLSVRTADMNF